MARPWRCYNKKCGRPLGSIIQGELVLQNGDPNVQLVCTEGAILNIQCAACGRVNKWVPRDSALIRAVMHMHAVKEFIAQLSMMWAHFQFQTDSNAEIAEEKAAEEKAAEEKATKEP